MILCQTVCALAVGQSLRVSSDHPAHWHALSLSYEIRLAKAYTIKHEMHHESHHKTCRMQNACLIFADSSQACPQNQSLGSATGN